MQTVEIRTPIDQLIKCNGYPMNRRRLLLATASSAIATTKTTAAASVAAPNIEKFAHQPIVGWQIELSSDTREVDSNTALFVLGKCECAVPEIAKLNLPISTIGYLDGSVHWPSSGDFFVDAEGTILSSATANDKDFPFVLQGWDEAKTEKAMPDNLARLKVYRKMLDEWKQYDLASRVKEVNLANPREPMAVVEDSGRAITVALASKDLGKSLRMAIEAVSGKGAKVKSVDAGGIYPVLQYLDF